MKMIDLAARLARKQHITKAQAADQLDGIVHNILRRLRKGEPASLPGIGMLHPLGRSEKGPRHGRKG